MRISDWSSDVCSSDLLEKTWDLAMEINDLPEAERADVAAAWNKFKASELVDPSRTEQEAAGQLPPRKVFCTNIYGIQFNPETKYWIPFRHGEIDLAKRSEEHTSELQSLMRISYAVFCLKKKKKKKT